jgi:hypothetical protein
MSNNSTVTIESDAGSVAHTLLSFASTGHDSRVPDFLTVHPRAIRVFTDAADTEVDLARGGGLLEGLGTNFYDTISAITPDEDILVRAVLVVDGNDNRVVEALTETVVGLVGTIQELQREHKELRAAAVLGNTMANHQWSSPGMSVAPVETTGNPPTPAPVLPEDGDVPGVIRLHQGQVHEETADEDVSSNVPNNGSRRGSSSHVVAPSFLQPEKKQRFRVQEIAVQEQPQLEDVAATVVALDQETPPFKQQERLLYNTHEIEARWEALAATMPEHVHRREHREQEPDMAAVIVHGTDENTGGGLGNNEEHNNNNNNNNNKVFGLPQSWIKWLRLLGAMVIILVVLVYFLVREPPEPDHTSRPTTPDPTWTLTTPDPTPTTTVDPRSVIINLLVEDFPDLKDTSSRPDSAEFQAMEWLTADLLSDGNILAKSDIGTITPDDVESLVQRFVMAVVCFGNIFVSTSNWLSPNSTCDWDGLGCGLNGSTSITSISLSATASLLQTFVSRFLILITLSFCTGGEPFLNGAFPTM